MSNKKKNPLNATSVRLKELKAPLQEEAMQIDRSMHWLIISIIKKHLKTK